MLLREQKRLLPKVSCRERGNLLIHRRHLLLKIRNKFTVLKRYRNLRPRDMPDIKGILKGKQIILKRIKNRICEI